MRVFIARDFWNKQRVQTRDAEGKNGWIKYSHVGLWLFYFSSPCLTHTLTARKTCGSFARTWRRGTPQSCSIVTLLLSAIPEEACHCGVSEPEKTSISLLFGWVVYNKNEHACAFTYWMKQLGSLTFVIWICTQMSKPFYARGRYKVVWNKSRLKSLIYESPGWAWGKR